MQSDFTKELNFALDFIKEAAVLANRHFLQGVEQEWKEDNSPVTKTDKQINIRLIELVKKKFPEDGVLAEEISHEVESSERLWVCDPIDGTRPFSHGIPIFGISLALVIAGEVHISVVADPILGRIIVSQKGKGATLDGQKITVNPSTSPNKILFALEGMTKLEKKEGFAFTLGFELGKWGAQVYSPKSIVYCGILTAIGQMGGAIFFLENPWDTAGISLAITEAGGIVTDLYGDRPLFDRPTRGLIASTPAFHPFLYNAVKNYQKYFQ